MQSTFISFPNNGASSSTISSSSSSSTLAAFEGLRPEGGEAERDSEERFVGLEPPVRVPRTAIGGGEGEVRESLNNSTFLCDTIAGTDHVDPLALPLEVPGLWLLIDVKEEPRTVAEELSFSRGGWECGGMAGG
jgi:hypothetical protein